MVSESMALPSSLPDSSHQAEDPVQGTQQYDNTSPQDSGETALKAVLQRTLLNTLEKKNDYLTLDTIKTIVLDLKVIDLETERMTFFDALYRMVRTYFESTERTCNVADICEVLPICTVNWEWESDFEASVTKLAEDMVELLPSEVVPFVSRLLENVGLARLELIQGG